VKGVKKSSISSDSLNFEPRIVIRDERSLFEKSFRTIASRGAASTNQCFPGPDTILGNNDGFSDFPLSC
jgi:hypothetical protein